MRSGLLALPLLLLAFLPGQAQAIKVDAKLPAYKPAKGITGTLTLAGSDAMEPLIQLWCGGFRKHHPGVQLKSSAQGSIAGYLALLEGDSLLGSMSREMTKPEQTAFEEKYGYPPLRLVVSLGAVAVFVHPTNPLTSLSLEQLDSLYSIHRKQGGKEPITTWGALGNAGDWANRRITLLGLTEYAGAREFLREKVLLRGDFRPTIATMDGAASLVEKISLDSGALGYGSLSDATSLVRVVPILNATGVKTLPTPEAVAKGDYPLTHFLYFYVNKTPDKPLPPLVQAFLVYVLSREGQTAAASGWLPIPADVARSMQAKLQ